MPESFVPESERFGTGSCHGLPPQLALGTGYWPGRGTAPPVADLVSSRSPESSVEEETREQVVQIVSVRCSSGCSSAATFCGLAILTIQLTPNLSVHIPKLSPQGASSRGIVTVPPSESLSQ